MPSLLVERLGLIGRARVHVALPVAGVPRGERKWCALECLSLVGLDRGDGRLPHIESN